MWLRFEKEGLNLSNNDVRNRNEEIMEVNDESIHSVARTKKEIYIIIITWEWIIRKSVFS
jgi:hypothetical protein